MVFREDRKCIIYSNLAADYSSMNVPKHDPCSTPYVKILVMAYVLFEKLSITICIFYPIACCSVINKISEKQPLVVCLLI